MTVGNCKQKKKTRAIKSTFMLHESQNICFIVDNPEKNKQDPKSVNQTSDPAASYPQIYFLISSVSPKV